MYLPIHSRVSFVNVHFLKENPTDKPTAPPSNVRITNKLVFKHCLQLWAILDNRYQHITLSALHAEAKNKH